MERELDRCKGTIFGLAIGDALGAAVEFLQPAEIKKQFPNGLKELIGGGWLDLNPGEFTDDTQMALLLAHSLIEKQEFNINDVASKYVAWMDSKPKDIGSTIKKALMNLKDGVSPYDSGIPKPDAGNGSLMRCAPLAVAYRKHKNLERVSSVESAITHSDHRCTAGCSFVNRLISDMINGKDYFVINSLLKLPYFSRFEGIALNKTEKPNPSGFILDTMEAVFYSLNTTNDFESSLVRVVNLGGDSDTTGAICGAIAGARYGYTKIPKRWLEKIQCREELEDVSQKLYLLGKQLK